MKDITINVALHWIPCSFRYIFGQTWRTVPAVLQSCLGQCLRRLSVHGRFWCGFVLASVSDSKSDGKLVVLISSNGISTITICIPIERRPFFSNSLWYLLDRQRPTDLTLFHFQQLTQLLH